MPDTLLDARLRVPNFVVQNADAVPIFPGIAAGDNGKSLRFNLKVNRIQRDINDGSLALVLPAFTSDTLTFSIIKYIITLHGTVYDDTHTVHPLASDTDHEPDFIDLEEAAVAWNNDAPANDCRLDIEFNGSTWRTYGGIILDLTLTWAANRRERPFILRFAVRWDETVNTLREWS